MKTLITSMTLALLAATPVLAAERVGTFSHDSAMAMAYDGGSDNRATFPMVASKPSQPLTQSVMGYDTNDS